MVMPIRRLDSLNFCKYVCTAAAVSDVAEDEDGTGQAFKSYGFT